MNTTRFTHLIASAAIALGGLAGTAAQAQQAVPTATKVYDGNKLIGLNGVTVSGSQYDVRFVVGQSCAQVFSGCDSASDLTFTTQASADAASNALRASLPASDVTSASVSNFNLLTPYSVTDTAWPGNPVASSIAGYAFNFVAYSSLGASFLKPSQVPGPQDYFAVWTPSVSAVPEPGTWALMAAGLAAAGVMARRRSGARRQA